MCTQKEGKVKIWNMLFTETKKEKNVFWANIIDRNAELLLSIDTAWKYDLRRIKRKFLQSDPHNH